MGTINILERIFETNELMENAKIRNVDWILQEEIFNRISLD